MWAELIRVYLKYLNDRIYQKIGKLDEMIFDEDWFVEAFFDQFSTGLVAENFIALTVEDKNKIYQLAKFVSNLKGTKLSLSTMLGLLNQDMMFDRNEKKVFENSIVEIIEKKEFNEVDPQPNPKLFKAPFTYGYESYDEEFEDQDFINVMEPLHPIGFNYRITYRDGYDRQELIRLPEFDLMVRSIKMFRWNGLYNRMGYVEINNDGYSLKNYPIMIKLTGEWMEEFMYLNV